MVVGGVDVTGKDRVDDVEASLTVEGSVNCSEATETVLLGETTTETPVEVAKRVKAGNVRKVSEEEKGREFESLPTRLFPNETARNRTLCLHATSAYKTQEVSMASSR